MNKPVSLLFFLLLCLGVFVPAQSQHAGHHQHHSNMSLDAGGMAMNSNSQRLPEDCEAISRDHDITVYAGTHYSEKFPDKAFGYSQYDIRVEPCSRVNVTFINEDEVRHQWMVHGLPRYLYNRGMFHLEAAGGTTRKGSFIVPGDHASYLVHCDIAQHMEMGMKAQLVVGKGSGELWAVPGVSRDFFPANYLPQESGLYFFGAMLFGISLSLLLLTTSKRR